MKIDMFGNNCFCDRDCYCLSSRDTSSKFFNKVNAEMVNALIKVAKKYSLEHTISLSSDSHEDSNTCVGELQFRLKTAEK